ncbi:MAG: FAD-dependent monooxygenase, partial [Casimicrobiaceae bacterium]|nr:FAD-dependent monooxygenase [Casimicrobiaceae bacterium]
YALEADWLVVADGARSSIRRMLGLDIEGKVFQDRFLIADVIMQADFPSERWFWFDPPFHPGQSVLLHRQADSLWRIDFQLGWQADPEEEKKPERVIPRIRAMLGPERPFELAWTSVYTFQCRRMKSFRHGRVLFAGDAAHQVSPFGARGANSGIQDADNLVWKLARVVRRESPERLLDSYSSERIEAADENIMNSTRSTDFITPKSAVSRLFRDATLALAREHAFARALVNSGRLSLPTIYTASPLSTPDAEPWAGGVPPGAPAEDAPLEQEGRACWLIDRLGGGFDLLLYEPEAQALHAAKRWAEVTGVRLQVIRARSQEGDTAAVLIDSQGRFAERYAVGPGAAILFRPDQHVCARWHRWRVEDLAAAFARATALAEPKPEAPACTAPSTAASATGAGFYDPRIAHPRAYSAGDAFYEALIEAHRDLSEAQSQELNARLILLLAHRVGNVETLRELFAQARQSLFASPSKEAV